MKGVGRATARLFAKNGYNVVIAARNPEKLKAAHAEIGRVSPAGSSMALSTDITDEAAVQQLVDAVTAKYETVNVVINCAGDAACALAVPPCLQPSQYLSGQCERLWCCTTGVCMTGALADTAVSDFVDQMNVNFLGAVTMTKGEPCFRIPGTLYHMSHAGTSTIEWHLGLTNMDIGWGPNLL